MSGSATRTYIINQSVRDPRFKPKIGAHSDNVNNSVKYERNAITNTKLVWMTDMISVKLKLYSNYSDITSFV